MKDLAEHLSLCPISSSGEITSFPDALLIARAIGIDSLANRSPLTKWRQRLQEIHHLYLLRVSSIVAFRATLQARFDEALRIIFFLIRADGGIRTPDQLITNQLLWPTELHRQFTFPSLTEHYQTGCKYNYYFFITQLFKQKSYMYIFRTTSRSSAKHV